MAFIDKLYNPIEQKRKLEDWGYMLKDNKNTLRKVICTEFINEFHEKGIPVRGLGTGLGFGLAGGIAVLFLINPNININFENINLSNELFLSAYQVAVDIRMNDIYKERII
jgi:hypothetical protein